MTVFAVTRLLLLWEQVLLLCHLESETSQSKTTIVKIIIIINIIRYLTIIVESPAVHAGLAQLRVGQAEGQVTEGGRVW